MMPACIFTFIILQVFNFGMIPRQVFLCIGLLVTKQPKENGRELAQISYYCDCKI